MISFSKNARFIRFFSDSQWRLCVFRPLLLPVNQRGGSAPTSNILLPSEIENEQDLLDLTVRTCTKVNPLLYYRPVIGASYVKFVESAGARVIPLIYNEAPEVLREQLGLVNGVVFTGGRVRTGLYCSVAEEIFQRVLKRNDPLDHVPL